MKLDSPRFVPVGVLGVFLIFTSVLRASTGGEVFVKNCAPCHGADGKALTPMAKKLGVRDLSVSRLADDAIERQILDGRKNDKGVQVMPAFREKLSSDEIQAIVTFVKSLRP